jgi:DedD protein
VNSQVKERIVGAVVLVALGVWLIPWVLDGTDEAEPVSPGLNLPVEGVSAPVRTEVVELEPTRRAPLASAADAGSAASTAPLDRPADSAAPSATEARPAPGGGDRADAGAADPVATPAEIAAEPIAATPAAPSAATTTAAATATVTARGAWSVQLGAFSDIANARQHVRRVGELGYEAEITEVISAGRQLNRVRIGGFATRAQAEAAQDSLAAHGFVPQVVASE